MGAALCLLSAVCFGAMAIFGKLAYGVGVGIDALLLVRFALASLMLGSVIGVQRVAARRAAGPVGWAWAPRSAARPEPVAPPVPARPARGLPGRMVLTALGMGAIGYAAQATLFFSALRLMDATLVSLLLYTYPVLVTVGAVLLGRERMSRVRAIALAAASSGVALVLLAAGSGAFHPVGVLLGAGAALVYTAYILIAEPVLRSVPPMLLTALVMTGATITFTVSAVLRGGVDLSFRPLGWVWLACIALVSTVLAILTFFAGLARVGPSTAAILSTFEPVVTVTLAALVLGEALRPLQAVGAALVLGSVVALQFPVRSRTKAQLRVEASEHAQR